MNEEGANIMIIHSIVPVDFLTEQPVLPVCTLKQFKGGMVEGIKTEQGFVINRIISTDPSIYLNPKYAPGQIFTE